MIQSLIPVVRFHALILLLNRYLTTSLPYLPFFLYRTVRGGLVACHARSVNSRVLSTAQCILVNLKEVHIH